jgi:hypothetical protein
LLTASVIVAFAVAIEASNWSRFRAIVSG